MNNNLETKLVWHKGPALGGEIVAQSGDEVLVICREGPYIPMDIATIESTVGGIKLRNENEGAYHHHAAETLWWAKLDETNTPKVDGEDVNHG